MLLIITGPTASGKDAVASKLLEKYPNFKKVITFTTRSPRLQEVNNQDYHFINVETFQKMQKNGEFLEINEYGGNYYGTSKESLKMVLSGQNLIWRIDPSAASQFDKLLLSGFDSQTSNSIIANTLVIYLTVPDYKTLKERLETRLYSKEEIESRLKTDQQVFKSSKFEHIILNIPGKLYKTVGEVSKLLEIQMRNKP